MKEIDNGKNKNNGRRTRAGIHKESVLITALDCKNVLQFVVILFMVCVVAYLNTYTVNYSVIYPVMIINCNDIIKLLMHDRTKLFKPEEFIFKGIFD